MTEQAFYERVCSDELNLSDEVLNDIRGLREKLEIAATEFEHELGSLYAINMCLHVAGSVILINPDHLKNAQNALRTVPGLEKKDLTTVLTVMTLYRLIEWDFLRANSARLETGNPEGRQQLAAYQEKLKLLMDGFDAINWVIGQPAMHLVGLRKGGRAWLTNLERRHARVGGPES